MKISLDTALIIITGLFITFGLLFYNIVRDIQDIQTRVTIIEEGLDAKGNT